MRTFRAFIIRNKVLPILGLLIGASVSRAQTAPPQVPAEPDFYPLAVGNYWRYRCTLEGQLKYYKTVRITAVVHSLGKEYFKQEQTGTGQTVVSYLHVHTDGRVARSIATEDAGAEIVGARRMNVGDSLGERHVTRTETIDTPATGHVSALVLENFVPDDPSLLEEQRLEWTGIFFVAGIGIAAQGDGAGADCSLTNYHIEHGS